MYCSTNDQTKIKHKNSGFKANWCEWTRLNPAIKDWCENPVTIYRAVLETLCAASRQRQSFFVHLFRHLSSPLCPANRKRNCRLSFGVKLAFQLMSTQLELNQQQHVIFFFFIDMFVPSGCFYSQKWLSVECCARIAYIAFWIFFFFFVLTVTLIDIKDHSAKVCRCLYTHILLLLFLFFAHRTALLLSTMIIR